MKLVAGIGSLSNIKRAVESFNVSKILLISGKGSFKRCGAEKILRNSLSKYEVIHFNNFAINPRLTDALKGAKIAEENNIQLIIAVGGGSVLDMAKLIKAFFGNTNRAFDIALGNEKVIDSQIPIIAVPTTAGSGSEETHFAVIYVKNEKKSVAADCLLPDFVILDGLLPMTASKYQKACNALDAISQSIESAWSVSSCNKSQKFALNALEQAMSNCKEYINLENPVEASQAMLVAANLAGKAINLSKTTAAHAWSYGFTSHYNIPHGHAVWLTLPKIFAIHASKGNVINDPRGEMYLLRVMKKLQRILKISSTNDIESFFKDFLISINIEGEMNLVTDLTVDNRIMLSQSVNLERMANNPVQFKQKQIDWIFQV